MQQNLEALRQAAVIYPIVAVLFTLPYIAWNYHKYGSVLSLRILVVYSFTLYMLCVYCLVILPLPVGDAAAALSGHRMQLIPFHFVRDILSRADFHWNRPASWLTLVDNPAFLTNLFNVLMTLPLGIYLRYYFQCGWKRTLLLSFLLSLFFELTQLSGLYFIYPGSYRLFDVDDLLMNTCGGMLGYMAARPLTRWLPSRQELDRVSFARGRQVSLLRRILALFYDLTLTAVLSTAFAIFRLPLGVWVAPVYFVICPMLLRGQTLGYRWTRMTLRREDGGVPRIHQYILRCASLLLGLVAAPLLLNYGLIKLLRTGLLSGMAALILCGAVNAAYLFALLFQMLRAAMHKPLYHERLSGTRLVSAVAPPDSE